MHVDRVRTWFSRSVRAAAAVAAVSLLLATPASGQAPAGSAQTYTPPRTPDGQPDLQGIWQVINTAAWDIQDHRARLGVPAGQGVVEDNEIPYQPWARKKKAENQKNWLTRDPEIKCYLPGIPRATYMPYPFQVFHNEDALFFAYEYAGAVRNIHLEDPGPPPIDSWMGQSVGKWEGDTLVIETTGQNDQTWLDRAGNFHSEALRVVERFTLTSAHTMSYQATLEDKKVFTGPWTIHLTLYRLVGDDARLQQFNCVEFVEELLYGHLRKNPLD